MKSSKIVVWNYLEEYKQNKNNILKIVDKVFQSGQLILSKEVENFENNFAKYTNTNFAIGVNSGTDALQIALMAIGIKENDEVIVTSYSYLASATCILRIGAKPVFVDVDKNGNMLIDEVENKITKKSNWIKNN